MSCRKGVGFDLARISPNYLNIPILDDVVFAPCGCLRPGDSDISSIAWLPTERELRPVADQLKTEFI